MTGRAVRRGFAVGESPIVLGDRRAGRSKTSRPIVAEAAGRTWAIRRWSPKETPAP